MEDENTSISMAEDRLICACCSDRHCGAKQSFGYATVSRLINDWRRGANRGSMDFGSIDAKVREKSEEWIYSRILNSSGKPAGVRTFRCFRGGGRQPRCDSGRAADACGTAC